MNNLRLGYTETTLLFFYYLDQKNIDNKNYIGTQLECGMQFHLINCLFISSGFYDKNISGKDHSDFNVYNIKNNSLIYHNYFDKLLTFCKKNNFHLELCFHQIDDNLLSLKEEFLQYINFNNKQPKYTLFTFIENKHILIINNLGSLMKQQFENGNVKNIHKDFPDNVKSIQFFENGYTFFNNGPDNNIIETANKLCNEIKKLEFDGAIISAGAYGYLIADFIINNLKKEAYVIGGELSFYFGINNNRSKMFHKEQINEFFIDVPLEMKPEGYEKIEGGCYW